MPSARGPRPPAVTTLRALLGLTTAASEGPFFRSCLGQSEALLGSDGSPAFLSLISSLLTSILGSHWRSGPADCTPGPGRPTSPTGVRLPPRLFARTQAHCLTPLGLSYPSAKWAQEALPLWETVKTGSAGGCGMLGTQFTLQRPPRLLGVSVPSLLTELTRAMRLRLDISPGT